MVTNNIRTAVATAEKTIDVVCDAVSSSLQEHETSQEEIMMQQFAAEAKRTLSATLNAASSIERGYAKDKMPGHSSDWGVISHSTEELLW